MDLSFLCPYITPVLSVFQQVLDAFFGAFSFLGVSAPSLTSLLSPILSCTS